MLRKTNIPVQFTGRAGGIDGSPGSSGGMDTKTAEQLVIPGTFLSIENGVRRKGGRVDKRFGFKSLNTNILGGTGAISTGRHLDRYLDEILLFDGKHGYTFSETALKWADRGAVPHVGLDTNPIVRNSFIQYSPDVAYVGGIAGYIYQDSRGGIRVSVMDDTAGTVLVADTQISATGTNPKAIALNNFIYFLFIDAADDTIKWVRVSVGAPTLSAVTSTTVIDADQTVWDIDVYETSASAVFAYNTTGGVIKYGYFKANGVIGTSASGYPNVQTLADKGNLAMSVLCDATVMQVYISYVDTGALEPMRLLVTDNQFFSSSATTVATSDVPDQLIQQIGMVKNLGKLDIYYSIPALTVTSFVNSSITYHAQYSISSTLVITQTIAPVPIRFGLSLFGRPFSYRDEVYVPVAIETTLQSTYFLYNQTADYFIAHWLSGVAGGLNRDASGNFVSGLARTINLAEGRYFTAVREINKLTVVGGVIKAGNVGVFKTQFNFVTQGYVGDTLGLSYCLAGGAVQQYDGANFVELGFYTYPETVITTTDNAAGSLPPNTNFDIQALYEWVDQQGQVHRSAPSILVTVNTGADTEIKVTVDTLGVTNKRAPVPNAKIVIYRSVVSGSGVLYRDNEATNIFSAANVTIALTQANATLATQEIIYTAGGALDNIAPHPCDVIHTHRNRMWIAGLEDPNQIQYSKYFTDGEGVAFNDGQLIQVDPLGDGVRALASLDEKLIIFKARRTHFLVGDGPTDAGTNNDYQTPQLISADVGCPDQNTIATIPAGLVFKSDKGIWLLSRGLGFSYIGAPVEAYNHLTVTGVSVVEDTNEVRFVTSDGSALVYNYFFNQWSVFSNHEAVSCISINNTFYHLKETGLVNKEIADFYNDNGTRIKLAIETSWFAVNGIQGFQRVYRIEGLGDFISDHYTHVQIAYDYEHAYNENIYFNVDDLMDLSYYGESSPYGSDPLFGGSSSTSGRFQFSIKPRRQKCEAIKLRIEDIDTKTLAGGGSFNFVHLAFEVGVKNSLNKMGAERQGGGHR